MRNLSRKIDFLVEKVRFSCGDDEMGRHGRKMSKIVSLVRVNRRPRAVAAQVFYLVVVSRSQQARYAGARVR